MRKRDKQHTEIMNDEGQLSSLCGERVAWQRWPVAGDSTKPSKATVIYRLAVRMANRFRSDPFMFKRVTSALWVGAYTPEDYMSQLNINWPELLKGATA